MKHSTLAAKPLTQHLQHVPWRAAIMLPPRSVKYVLVQREVLCNLLLATLQSNRVSSAIKPGHINSIA